MTSLPLHPLLSCQLADLGLSADRLPSTPEAWAELLGQVSQAYEASENTRTLELQRELALTSRLLEVSPGPIFVKDAQERLQLVNEAWVEFFQVPRERAIGKRSDELFKSANLGTHHSNDQRLIQEGGRTVYEYQFRRPDGSLRDVVMAKVALMGDDGRPMGLVGALTDVTRFHEAERAIAAARDEAQAASALKTEFIANISHELRTPLTLILGFSELGQRRSADQPRLVAMFNDILGAGQRMLALVNDLLDLSKMDASLGTTDLQCEDVVPQVRALLDEMRPLAAVRQIGLRGHGWVDPHPARINAFRFQQVLRNVLANAIRFSPVDATVDVRWSRGADGGVQLRVADQGPGIPAGELDSIFDAFVQSSRTKDGSGGTGLGLAICRRIMAAHGGSIWAENGEGGGAVFHIDLPPAGPVEEAAAQDIGRPT
jgi:PAS domain S-box-containing protein